MPVPPALIEDEVHRHLEGENRLEDDEHRAEVTTSSENTFRTQILLDAVVDREQVKVSQDELTQYLVQSASQYGMEPNEFVKILSESNQIPAMVAEVARNKALAIVLSKAKIVDTDGKPVDISEFTVLAGDDDESDNLLDAVDADEADEHEGHDHDGHDHAGHSH